MITALWEFLYLWLCVRFGRHHLKEEAGHVSVRSIIFVIIPLLLPIQLQFFAVLIDGYVTMIFCFGQNLTTL